MDLDAARTLMPPLVLPLSALLHAGVAAVLSCAVGALLCALGRRAIARRAPWPLRARALFVYRWALDMAGLLFAVPLAYMVRYQGFLGGAPALSAMVASLLVLGFWRWRLTRTVVGHDHTLRRVPAALAVRAVVLSPQLWTILPLAIAMPLRADVPAALVLVAMLVLLRVMPFVRRLAPPAPPEIAVAVLAASAKAGIRIDGVCQIDLPEANVYALPFSRRIAFTRAALWKVDRAALLALAQLEILRMRKRRAAICAAAVLVVAPVVAAKAAGVPMVAAALVAIAFANAFHLRPYPFDTRLDREASAAEPVPGAYARALAETHRLNLVPAVVRPVTWQPSLFDRLLALGAPLPYPRPPRPSVLVYIALVALTGLASIATSTSGPLAAWFADRGSWTAAALSANDAWFAVPLGNLARARHAARRYDDAARLYGAAAALTPKDPRWPAYQSMSLAAAGRVEAAERALAEAQRRGADGGLVAEARERIARRR